MGNRANQLEIRTPEGISFNQLLAGPTTRFMAWGIDAFTIALIWYVVIRMLGWARLISPDMTMALLILLHFLIMVGYGIILEWLWRGQTLGKRLLRLRVISEDGLHLRFEQVVIRNLLRFLDFMPACYMVGGTICLLTARFQRAGDFAAGTVVVRHPKPIDPDLEQLLAGKYNSLLGYPHLCARLRQAILPEQGRIALQALIRRDELEPEARVELFGQIAERLRRATAFPEECTQGMTDEQFVRNAMDVVFQAKHLKGRETREITG